MKLDIPVKNNNSKLNLFKRKDQMKFFGPFKIKAQCFDSVVRQKRDRFEGKEEYFLRNGAFLLEKQISSSQSQGKRSDEPLRIFSAQDIKRATNNYDDSLIISRSIATIYKGTLEDQTVAIKIPEGDPTDVVLEFFLNQVTTKLQISHKNVVKLLGCCIETRVPILVYEFISNGTLFKHLHRDMDISWRNRLKIATEIAYTLCYMHCATSKPIVHRDVRSLNIFLDDNYTAKLTNFGLSVSITPGKEFTKLKIQGSLGYIDPEYILTQKVTEKCDVFGFGALLVELLTGKKPSVVMEECGASLMEYLALALRDNQISHIVDKKMPEQCGVSVAEAEELAKIALRCVGLKGEDRPCMKEVVEELQKLQKSKNLLD